MLKKLFVLSIIFTFFNTYSQCNSDSLIINQIRAKDTDTNINWELNKHFSFYNSVCTQRGVLVVHLVGSYDNPSNNLVFPSHAANNGFHVVSLKYPNSTAAQSSCGSNVDLDCYNNFRKEIIQGGDYHPDLTVDIANSVYNRLIKLLQYLDINNPNQNWNQYYTTNSINWSKIIISGHSQGGGHAAYIAKDQSVKRVLMFASPNDYSSNYNAPASWTTQPHQTADSLYYGFNNLYDDVVDFSDQFEIWNALNMPSQGDSLCVDIYNSYFTSKQLYTITTGPNANQNHSLMIRDDQLIVDAFGNSIFLDVWDYMLGITEGLNINDSQQLNTITIYPIPTSGVLNISSPKQIKSIAVYNLIGQRLKTSHTPNKININELSSGIYIVKVIFKNGNISSKKITKN